MSDCLDTVTLNISSVVQPIDLTLNTNTEVVNLSVYETGGLTSRWGYITGQISDQLDLQQALYDAAANAITSTVDLSSLSGIVVSQLSGLIPKIRGTTNQINVSSFNNLVTVSLPNSVIVPGDINATGHILSGGKDLANTFITKETQTLNFNPTDSHLQLTVTNSDVSLYPLSYSNYKAPRSVTINNNSYNIDTIQNFTNYFYLLSASSGSLYPGFTITLYNGRTYAFTGTDATNSNYYLEVNLNPCTPIYAQIDQTVGTSAIIDTFDLNVFKTAKYNIQVETNYNNDIYYSELNVVGSPNSGSSVVCEYSQISTNDIINGYSTNVSVDGKLQLSVVYNTLAGGLYSLILKGQRTNFYKI